MLLCIGHTIDQKGAANKGLSGFTTYRLPVAQQGSSIIYLPFLRRLLRILKLFLPPPVAALLDEGAGAFEFLFVAEKAGAVDVGVATCRRTGPRSAISVASGIPSAFPS